MIEMIADLIALILGLIKKGNIPQATKLLDNAYREFLKEDASFFRNLPKEKLTDELLSEHNYSNDHLKILSELFFAEGEIHYAKEENRRAFEYYEKSLLLLEFTEQNSNTFSLTNESRMNKIKEKINISKQ